MIRGREPTRELIEHLPQIFSQTENASNPVEPTGDGNLMVQPWN